MYQSVTTRVRYQYIWSFVSLVRNPAIPFILSDDYVKYWWEKVRKSGRRDITEILLKNVLHSNQSIARFLDCEVSYEPVNAHTYIIIRNKDWISTELWRHPKFKMSIVISVYCNMYNSSVSIYEPLREKTNILDSAYNIDPDQPKHDAQAHPGRHFSPSVDFLFHQS